MSRLVESPVDLLADLAAGQALLGLDLGTKTIGVAVSDTRRTLATPLETMKKGRFAADAAHLAGLAAQRGAGGFVLGLPRNMDGSEGPRAQASRAFGRNLARATGLPVALWDERLTTVAAERSLIEADASRRRRAAVIDRMAAALILQGALDRLAHAAAADADRHDAVASFTNE